MLCLIVTFFPISTHAFNRTVPNSLKMDPPLHFVLLALVSHVLKNLQLFFLPDIR